MLFDEDLRQQVAWSCRILAMHGHTDLTLGHVSARSAKDIVYIKRKDIGLDEVTPADVLAIDLDGNVLDGDGVLHLETPLHTEVYKLRPDVNAIAHTHPPYATALGAADAELQLINHDSILFYDGLSSFDENAGLITSDDLGLRVAYALGSRRVVLMRNHGVLIVGRSTPWMTYTAITLERAIAIQTIAAALGPLQPLDATVAQKLFAEKYRDEFIDSYWQYLIRRTRAGAVDLAGFEDERQGKEE